MHPKLLNQVWVCRGTGVINRGAQLIISTLKAASGVHLWVNLVVSLSIGVVCFCGRGESECGVCVCLCWNGLFCPTILPVRSFLSLSLSLTGRVGSCQCGRRSGRGLFMMGFFGFVLFFSPIFVSTSRNLFWVQWGSPSGRVRGWVYPLYPPPLRLFSLFTSLSLAPRLPSSPSSSLPVRAAKQMPAKQPGALCPRVTSHLQFSPL